MSGADSDRGRHPPTLLLVEPFLGYRLPPLLSGWTDRFRHVVPPGETLPVIAAAFGTTPSSIQGLNQLTDTAHLFAWEVLAIPVGYSASVALPAVPPAAALVAWPRVTEYVMTAGDTLEALAARFFTTAGALALHNGITDPGQIPIGGTIRIPRGFLLDVSEVGILFAP